MKDRFDYIICGAGAAGLSLAVRLANTDKEVLLLDSDAKDKNDRTFSFWKQESGFFDNIIAKTWPNLKFLSDDVIINLDIGDYSYNMIRGLDFYEHCMKIINDAPNLHFKQERVEKIIEDHSSVSVYSQSSQYQAEFAFKSYFDQNIDFSKTHFVIQHFLGYEVKCPENTFDETSAIFMDFSIPQGDETRFMYVLPSNDQQALIELAIFSNDIPEDSFYEGIINKYIDENLGIKQYDIESVEKGSIPMTDYKFPFDKTSRIIPIGTAAGVVKPSSGYAFQRIQEHSDAIINCIGNNEHPSKAQGIFKARFKKYDSIFLNAILTGKTTGKKVFTHMFKKTNAELMFRFLDERTKFHEDITVFNGPPMIPFIRAFLQEMA
jgi:lycopene beta-cyclase